jgi:hypothetical protein
MNLNDLRKGTDGITPDFGGTLCEAASVCLEHRSHQSGVSMSISGGIASDPVALTWPPTNDQMRRCYEDLQFATELGAYGVAILVVEELTEHTVIARSVKGTGFDYWLGPKGSTAPLFQDKSRLEVTGILDGDEDYLRRRLQDKMKQLATGGVPLPGYGVVVHFGNPETRIGTSP